MTKSRTDTLERLYKHVWVYGLTPSGRVLVVTGVIVGAIGTPSLEVPVFYTFFALLALGFVARLVNLTHRPGRALHVTGAFPEKATAGNPVTGTFTLRNEGRMPRFDLSVGYFGLNRSLRAVNDERCVARLNPGQSAAVPVTIEPLRRGVYALPPLMGFTTFPFNIARAGRRLRPETPLVVLPDFVPLTGMDVPVGSRYQPGGISLTSDVGESPEYIGNREYRPGDPTRRIDPRAWARIGKPVVREFQEEYYCRIALILDTFVPRRRGRRPREGFPDLEAAVSLSAAVADALSRGEYIIDIFAAGPELYVFRSGRHTAHLESVLEILAAVDECRHNPFETVAPALSSELGNISTVICVLLDWDAAREGLVREAAEAGCSAKVMIVRDGPTTMPFAGAEGWAGSITQVSPRDVSKGGLDWL